MGVPTSEVGYTSATTGRGDHEVHKEHVVALEEKQNQLPMLANLHTVNCSNALPEVRTNIQWGGKKLLRSLDLVLCGSHEPIHSASQLTIPLKYIYLQVKLKFNLEQATKVRRGSTGIALLFL
jgi:hypothetical protein